MTSFYEVGKKVIGATLDKPFKIIEKIFGLALIASHLDKETLGLYTLIVTTFFSLNFLLEAGIGRILVKDLKKEKFIKIGIFLIIRIITGISYILLGIGLLILFKFENNEIVLIAIIGYIIKALLVTDLLQYYYLGCGKNYVYTIIDSLASLIHVFLIYLGTIYDQGINYYITIFVFQTCLKPIILPFITFTLNKEVLKYFNWEINIVSILSYIKLSVPLMLVTFLTVALWKIDIFILNVFIDNSEIAIYAAATSISQSWYFLPLAIANIFAPKIVKSKELNKPFKTALLMNVIACLAMILIVLLSIEFVINTLYDSSYRNAIQVAQIHSIGGIYIAFNSLWLWWLVANNKGYIYLYGQITAILLNVIFNIYLIPKFGIMGSAIASVLSVNTAQIISIFYFSPKSMLKIFK